jgi:DNA repair protein RadA/Sms
MQARPKLLVADSIQTLWTEHADRRAGLGQPGARVAARLVRYAKETGTAVFLVGHVTKEGGIAGPRVLEHMVDAVLYFEGDAGSRFRVLRAFKNRFGAVNELGVFAMSDGACAKCRIPRRSSCPAAACRSRQLRDGDARGYAAACWSRCRRWSTSPLSNPRRVAGRPEGKPLAMLLAVASPWRAWQWATRTCS